jgi:hypothetical protein
MSLLLRAVAVVVAQILQPILAVAVVLVVCLFFNKVFLLINQ